MLLNLKGERIDNKMIKKKNIINSLIVTCCFICMGTITSFSLEDKDYIEQNNIIEQIINEKNKEIRNLEKEADSLKTQLKQSETDIIETQKLYKIKKESNYNIGNDNKFKLLELVLNSDSIGKLFKNLDIAKEIYVQKNKSLNLLNSKEEQLLELRNSTNDKYNKILDEISDKKEELKETKIQEEQLKKVIGEKSGKIVFNPNNLLQKSNISVSGMYKALKGTALYDLAPVYVEAENTYGVNALFITGLTAQESGWGTSSRAKKDNNLTGFGVYSNSSKGINAQSKRENILMTTKWIKTKYLTKGESCYNGYGIKDVNVMYCMGPDGKSDFNWSKSISEIANKLLEKIDK